MPRPSLLTGGLAVTNVLLLAHILLPRRLVARWLRRLTTSLRPQLVRQPSDQQSVPQSRPLGAELGGLLGKDYLPPLPQPVADALDRSRLWSDGSWCVRSARGWYAYGGRTVAPPLRGQAALSRRYYIKQGPGARSPYYSTDGRVSTV